MTWRENRLIHSVALVCVISDCDPLLNYMAQEDEVDRHLQRPRRCCVGYTR